jgi:LacI family transcriptional regulator
MAQDGSPVTIHDVARHCGVSLATVSKALSLKPGSGEVSTATRERVRTAAKELGYAADWRTRRLASRRTRTIGLVYVLATPLLGGVYQALISSIATAVTARGYRLVLAPAQAGVASWEEVMRQFHLDGCIASEPLPADAASWAPSEHLPVVAINVEAGGGLSQVLADDARAAAIAVEHLAALGHRRIAYLGPGLGGHPSIAARARGFAAAVRMARIDGRAVRLPGRDGDTDAAAVRAAWPDATAIIAYNHHVARGVIHACHETGRRIPTDLALVSCDDIPALTYPVPAITAVRVPAVEMATAAATLLIDCIEGRAVPGGQRILIAGELIVRGSTAPPAAG